MTVLLLWLFEVRWWRSLIVALISIVLHDLFDVLIGHRRQLWWPISGCPVSSASREAGLSMTSEVLVFGGAFVGLLVIRWLWRWRSDRSCQELTWTVNHGGHSWRQVWVTGGGTAVLFLAVVATQYLRDLRERQLDLAWTMINQKRGPLALDLLDQAQQWPSTARPGRIDYARAEAYADMGQRAKAEQYYLRSYQADPFRFWMIVDLAVFYASSDEPLEVRRRRVAPYLGRLIREFGGEPSLPRYLDRLERKLAESPTGQVSRTKCDHLEDSDL